MTHQWITRQDNHADGYRGKVDDPRAIRWATRMLQRLFSPDWGKWHYTEGSGLFTACDMPVQLFALDGSPQEGGVGRINCKKCLRLMRKHAIAFPDETHTTIGLKDQMNEQRN